MPTRCLAHLGCCIGSLPMFYCKHGQLQLLLQHIPYSLHVKELRHALRSGLRRSKKDDFFSFVFLQKPKRRKEMVERGIAYELSPLVEKVQVRAHKHPLSFNLFRREIGQDRHKSLAFPPRFRV